MARTKIKGKKNSIPNQVKHRANYPLEETTNLVYVSTGSTLLNLGLSDIQNCGFAMGKIANIIGDQSSGKSLLSLSILAEATHNSCFDKYNLIYDDVEAALAFNISKLFGRKLASRMNTNIVSDTIEDFKVNILKQKGPFIYVLDSLDALSSRDEQSRTEKEQRGKKAGGSYKMEKALIFGETLRQTVRKLKENNSFLIIISQTRDNINPMSFAKKRRSGGRALYFYSTYELWTAVAGRVVKKNHTIGVKTRVRITKNKTIGKQREIEFPILYEYGIDDLGSLVDWLVEKGIWSSPRRKIKAPNLKLEYEREKLIRKIEEKRLEGKVRKEAQKTWLKIENSLKLNRKRKYK